MERSEVIRSLNSDLETLTRLHIRHGLHHTEGFRRQMERISNCIRENDIDARTELDPIAYSLYRRYFD